MLSKKKKDNVKEVVPTNVAEMTEDQIIKKGLKTNTKKDILCYVGMFVLFILIFIPPIFRVVFYDPNEEIHEYTVVYINLRCRKAYFRGGLRVDNNIESNYKDSALTDLKIEYVLSDELGDNNIEEINQLEELSRNNPNIQKQVSGNTYTYFFDYSKYPDFRTEEFLKNYSRPLGHQLKIYREEQKYTCESQSREEIERRRGDEVIK